MKAIRLWLGMSQREMAGRLGVTDSYLCQIEAGRPVSDAIRIKIAQTFDVTAEMLEAIRRAKLADQLLV
ncbi:helix-turn-helix transcriptional regulator [Cohnella phaseoli]|uniref:helix-turn-helix transcriptional regulator n=1 Tax=Cohnella phaseoli TaxID=456490 RepID=UPI003CCC6FA3